MIVDLYKEISMPKFIKVPDPIVPIDGDKKLTYSLRELVNYIIDNEARFQSPASKARQGVRLLSDFDEEEGGVVEIKRDEDHAFLNEVLENPGCGYGSWYITARDANGKTEVKPIKVPTHKYLSLIDAVDQATNGDPRKVEKV